MNNPARILIVDDNEVNRDILDVRLKAHGYLTLQAADGEEALAAVRAHLPDLVLLDVMMPKIGGLEVCRRVKNDSTLPYTPIILVTAKSDTKDIVAGLDAGADEHLAKPIDQAALVARVRSMLRVKALQDQVRSQAADLACWNRTLEQRVTEQLAEIERIGRLKHFLSHQIAELVLSSGGERLLESHRREITVVCCDLRGFTAFGESADPEDVMTVLREYHATLGRLIQEFEGTLEHFAGDSLLVLFNDPLPCPDPCSRAVTMAIEMRDRMAELASQWRTFGHDLGFGIGIAHGFATLGCIGFEGRLQYSATGSVANRACRLCSEAHNGQILIDSTVHSAVETCVRSVPAGELALKGFRSPVPAFSVCSLTRGRASDLRTRLQPSAAPLLPRGRPCASIGANQIEQSASALPDFRLSTDSAARTRRCNFAPDSSRATLPARNRAAPERGGPMDCRTGDFERS